MWIHPTARGRDLVVGHRSESLAQVFSCDVGHPLTFPPPEGPKRIDGASINEKRPRGDCCVNWLRPFEEGGGPCVSRDGEEFSDKLDLAQNA